MYDSHYETTIRVNEIMFVSDALQLLERKMTSRHPANINFTFRIWRMDLEGVPTHGIEPHRDVLFVGVRSGDIEYHCPIWGE